MEPSPESPEPSTSAAIACSFVVAALLCKDATHIEPIGWLGGTFPVPEMVIHQYRNPHLA